MVSLRVSTLAFLAALSFAPISVAQEQMVWIQVEAKSDPSDALSRAADFAQTFPETQGYELQSGWFGIVLGPYPEGEARQALANMKASGMIPSDSYITKGDEFLTQYYDSGLPRLAVEPPPTPAPMVETLENARVSEAALSPIEKRALQEALGWFGFYAGAVDGAFGAGTRQSMALWQSANGYEPTGVLTAAQRQSLSQTHLQEIEAFGFAEHIDDEAGIKAVLPLELVAFDRYQPPFVHFKEKNGSGLQISLISKPGDQAELAALYSMIEALQAMPMEGERSLTASEFSIIGQSASYVSHAYARQKSGAVKGWLMVSKPENATRDQRILGALRQSFEALGGKALDPGLVPLDEDTRRGLLAGLEVKKPKIAASGLYVSAEGAVLTHQSVVSGCAKVTIDRQIEAKVTPLNDGLALLTSLQKIAPSSFAHFNAAPPLGAEISLSGYSYGERLPAPVLTKGVLEEASGLNGESGILRLSIEALEGDIGGPILDASGAVTGLLIPMENESRQLPKGVGFAAAATLIEAELTAAGLRPAKITQTAELPPEKLQQKASQMTALVSCWD